MLLLLFVILAGANAKSRLTIEVDITGSFVTAVYCPVIS
jgi:hypothetical protein